MIRAFKGIIAAGTLLTEGTRIPARTLTTEEVAGIRSYSDNDVGYRLEYMKGEE